MRFAVIGAIATAIAVGALAIPGLTAHVWLGPGGSDTCTRSGPLVTLSGAQAGGNECKTLDKAYHVAQQGDDVLVEAGSYCATCGFPAISADGSKTTNGSYVTFRCASASTENVTVDTQDFWLLGDHIKFDGGGNWRTGTPSCMRFRAIYLGGPTTVQFATDTILTGLHAQSIQMEGSVSANVNKNELGPSIACQPYGTTVSVVNSATAVTSATWCKNDATTGEDWYYARDQQFTGNTHSSTTIDGIASTAALTVGYPILGIGIPTGATIAGITNGTTITISNAATTTTVGVTLASGVYNCSEDSDTHFSAGNAGTHPSSNTVFTNNWQHDNNSEDPGGWVGDAGSGCHNAGMSVHGTVNGLTFTQNILEQNMAYDFAPTSAASPMVIENSIFGQNVNTFATGCGLHTCTMAVNGLGLELVPGNDSGTSSGTFNDVLIAYNTIPNVVTLCSPCRKRSGADLVGNGTTTVTSATAAFVSSDVGAGILVSGTWHAIQSVTNPTTAILDTTVAAGAGQSWKIVQGLYVNFRYLANLQAGVTCDSDLLSMPGFTEDYNSIIGATCSTNSQSLASLGTTSAFVSVGNVPPFPFNATLTGSPAVQTIDRSVVTGSDYSVAIDNAGNARSTVTHVGGMGT